MPSPRESFEPANRELYEELLNEGASKEQAASIAHAVAATEARERRSRSQSSEPDTS